MLQRARALKTPGALARWSNRVHAWRDLCDHRGTRLSLGKIQGETLMCSYYDWTYNEDGQCIRFPAHPIQKPPMTACAKTYYVREKYHWIWVCLGHPTQDIPPFEQWDDPSFRKIHCGPYTYQASAPRAVENFSM